MYCTNCHNYVADGTRVCPYCHSAIPQVQQNYYTKNQTYNTQPQPTYTVFDPIDQQYKNELSNANTFGIIALIMGIIGSAIIAWVCGGIGLSKANSVPDLPQYANEKHKARLMNIWGIVIPIIRLALGILVWILFALFMTSSAYYY